LNEAIDVGHKVANLVDVYGRVHGVSVTDRAKAEVDARMLATEVRGDRGGSIVRGPNGATHRTGGVDHKEYIHQES
jgi:hypothetical protein